VTFSLEHQMSDIVALKAANAHRLQVAGIAPKRQAEVSAVAVRLAAPVAKTRYQAMEAATGVPWFVVAVIHARLVAAGTSSVISFKAEL
jgi:lysozyme family protein